jgi:hypothetical protein
MKQIAKTLGMDEPDMDEMFGTNAEDETPGTSLQETNYEDGEELPIPVINDRLEEALINGGYDEVQKLINHATAHGIQIAELARDMEPRYKARLLEVGAQYFNIALNSVKQKQEMAFKNKDHKFKRATTGMPSQMSNTQVNNFYGSRDEVMKMIEEGTIVDVDTESNPDDQ